MRSGWRQLQLGGEMAEWLKAHAWKACILQKGIEGSNPSLSASLHSQRSKSEGCRAEVRHEGGLERMATRCVASYDSAGQSNVRSERSAERRLPRRSAEHEGGPEALFIEALRATTRQASSNSPILILILIF